MLSILKPVVFLRRGLAVVALMLLHAPQAYSQAQMADRALQDARSRVGIPSESGIDLEHGRDVVMGRAKCVNNSCMPCFQCHGVQGQGNAALAYPRLAGQNFRYLYNSLHDFASGRRHSAIMTPIAGALPPDAWRDVAAFYSLQKIELHDMAAAAQHTTKTHAETLAHGSMIASIGIAERGVQGCVNCHGPQGAGLPPTYPYLAGQYANYLQDRLMAWKKATVAPGDYGYGVMEEIAQRLTEDDIRAVSEYFAAIRPPRIVRDENYSGPLRLGVPLGRQRELHDEKLSPRNADEARR